MVKKSFPLARVYQLLEPGPVIMVTTVAADGTPNVMTMAWYMMVDFEPPLIACVMGEGDYSFKLLQTSRECVINIPTAGLLDRVVGVGKTTGAEIDKFKKFNFTKLPARMVQAPLIAECYAHIECKVINTQLVQPYNIFILQGVYAWMTPSTQRQRTFHHAGNGLFIVDGKTIKVPFRSRS